jgi:23S rRNA pseudouridine1911/1915/1917 synthase
VVAPSTLTRTWKLDSDAAGKRVELLVVELLSCSRAEARALCSSGAVRLDGRRVDKGVRAASGSILEVRLPAGDEVVAEPDLALDVRLERPDLVVVCKPAGMPTVPLSRGERGTLAGALIARYPEMLAFGYGRREPGVLHRLDTQTSGLVVAARDAATFERLKTGLGTNSLEKRYVALCEQAGLEEDGAIDLPLCPDPGRYGRVMVAGERASYSYPSRTAFRILERGPRFALLELTVARAFRHQIRAHLAAIGHPIVGDRLYGGPLVEEFGERHALHASAITWPGRFPPAFSVTDTPPAEFLAVLRVPST